MTNIVVLVSGGGTNLQAIIDAAEGGDFGDARITLVISSKAGVYALERAEMAGIPTLVIGRREYPNEWERTRALLSSLRDAEADLIVLAGYMSILPPLIIQQFPGRIINIHPSLLPKYSGKGFYGMRVHAAVIAAGEGESGATVHFVDEEVDHGPIIMQEKVKVLDGDSPEDLAARVLEVEHRILVSSIKSIISEWNSMGEGI